MHSVEKRCKTKEYIEWRRYKACCMYYMNIKQMQVNNETLSRIKQSHDE